MIGNAIKFFKEYFRFLVHSWFGEKKKRLALEALIINDNRDLLKKQIRS